MSSADRTKFYLVEETTAGVTPTNAAMLALRLLNDGLKIDYNTEASKELDDNRAEREEVQVGKTVGGDIGSELVWDVQLLQLMAAAVGSVWSGGSAATGTVDNGSTLRYFSLLKQFVDLTNVNHLYKGLVVNTFALNLKKKAIVDLTLGLMGMDFANGVIGTILSGTPTFGAKSNNVAMNGSSNVTALLLDSVPFTSCLDALTLNITNNMKPQECVGNLAPIGFVMGKIQVTGSMDLYFKDETLFNKFKNAQSFTLDITFTDAAAKTLALSIPRAKFEACDVVAGGTGQDVVAKCKFRGLYDSTATRVLRWTST